MLNLAKLNPHRPEDRTRILENVNVTDDKVFKFLFGSEKNKDLTIDLLNSYLKDELKREISTLEFKNTEIAEERYEYKQIRYDICCILDDNETVDIEVQLVDRKDFTQRSLYYLARLYAGQYARGLPYKRLKPCITFNILGFTLFPGNSDPLSMSAMMNVRTHERINRDLTIFYLELPKFRLTDNMSKADMWTAFLSDKLTLSQKEMLGMAQPHIKKACDGVKRYLSDDAQFMRYFNEEINRMDWLSETEGYFEDGKQEGIQQGIQQGMQKGIQQGVKKGMQQGIEDTQRQTLQNLLKNGYDLKTVKIATGLSEEQIKTMASELGFTLR